jgi:hypothetical protein
VVEKQGEYTLSTWSKDELHKIADTDDLHISPFREDGVTYGTFVMPAAAIRPAFCCIAALYQREALPL